MQAIPVLALPMYGSSTVAPSGTLHRSIAHAISEIDAALHRIELGTVGATHLAGHAAQDAAVPEVAEMRFL